MRCGADPGRERGFGAGELLAGIAAAQLAGEDFLTGLAAVTGRMLEMLPAARAVTLTGAPVIIDLDTTDVEVYGVQEARRGP